jgi:hypothetical protein
MGSRCAVPPGMALRAGGSMVTLPGRTPLLVSGCVGDAVSSVQVVYADGDSREAAVANGYFLGWGSRRRARRQAGQALARQ